MKPPKNCPHINTVQTDEATYCTDCNVVIKERKKKTMKRQKVKILYRYINDNAWVNDTWLSPYSDYPVILLVYKSGRKDLILDGTKHENMQGYWTAPNGWKYKIEKLLNHTIAV